MKRASCCEERRQNAELTELIRPRPIVPLPAIVAGKRDMLPAQRCDMAARGIGFRSLTEQIDTTTSGGMLVFNIFGSLAQFERDLIRERTNAGLKAARERGSLGGRRPVITPDKLKKARTHIAAGLTVREAATRLKVGKTTLYKALEGTAAKTAVKA